MSNGSDLEKDNLFDGTYFPRVRGHISHYYGDHVRKMFLGVAVALLLSAPFLTGVLSPLAPLHIIIAPLLIGLSALTNPKNQMIMLANAGAAVVGAILFEIIAFALYRQGFVWATISYEALALVLVFGLYFSLKTARAMREGLIGKRDLPGEFLEEKYRQSKDDL